MLANEPLSVARRAMDLEDYLDILRRHKAWILGPAFATLVIGVVVAFLWPDTYVSSAMIKVVPQQVPEQYVPANVVQEMSTRISAMAQNIMSRSNLTNYITTFGLYPREKLRMPIEDIIELMKKDIKISPVAALAGTSGRQNVPAFTISFSYEQRGLANKVVTELASKFISENVQESTDASEQTTKFLDDEWEKARKDVEARDTALAEFRTKNAGRLPEQAQAGYQALNQYDQRLSNLQMALSRAQQDKMVMESQRRILESQLRSLTPPSDQVQAAAKSERVAEKERQLEQAETQLAALRERYRDNYPEVERMDSVVRLLRRQRDEALKEDADNNTKKAQGEKSSTAPARPVSPAFLKEQREYEANIQRIDTALRVKDQEMEDTRKEIAQTNAAVKAVQGKLEVAPMSDQQYSELIRDRDLARTRYEDLSKRRTQSALSTAVIRRSQGERLELLDPASMPMTPSAPNRPIVIGAAFGLGVFLGLLLAGVREMRDTSLKNLKDVRAYTQLNILGVAPLLENDLVVRRRRRLAYLAWTTAVLVGCTIMATSVFYYFNFRA